MSNLQSQAQPTQSSQAPGPQTVNPTMIGRSTDPIRPSGSTRIDVTPPTQAAPVQFGGGNTVDREYVVRQETDALRGEIRRDIGNPIDEEFERLKRSLYRGHTDETTGVYIPGPADFLSPDDVTKPDIDTAELEQPIRHIVYDMGGVIPTGSKSIATYSGDIVKNLQSWINEASKTYSQSAYEVAVAQYAASIAQAQAQSAVRSAKAGMLTDEEKQIVDFYNSSGKGGVFGAPSEFKPANYTVNDLIRAQAELGQATAEFKAYSRTQAHQDDIETWNKMVDDLVTKSDTRIDPSDHYAYDKMRVAAATEKASFQAAQRQINADAYLPDWVYEARAEGRQAVLEGKPAGQLQDFGNLFTPAAYQGRFDQYQPKSGTMDINKFISGSTAAAARFMGEGQNVQSRSVVYLNEQPYFYTSYGKRGYELRDTTGQIRSAGSGDIPLEQIRQEIDKVKNQPKSRLISPTANVLYQDVRERYPTGEPRSIISSYDALFYPERGVQVGIGALSRYTDTGISSVGGAVAVRDIAARLEGLSGHDVPLQTSLNNIRVSMGDYIAQSSSQPSQETETTSEGEPSWFDSVQKNTSDWIKSRTTEPTTDQVKLFTTSQFIAPSMMGSKSGVIYKPLIEYNLGESQGVRERPIEFAASAAIGLAFAGVGKLGAVALPRIAAIPGVGSTAAKITSGVGKTALGGLGALYAVDVGARVSTAPSPARELGAITTSEFIPLAAGGFAGTKLLNTKIPSANEIKTIFSQRKSTGQRTPIEYDRSYGDELTMWRRGAEVYENERIEAAFKQYSALNSPDLYPRLKLPEPMRRIDEPALWRRVTEDYAQERAARAARINAPDLYPQLRLPEPRKPIDEPALWRRITELNARERAERIELNNLRLDSPDIGDVISAGARRADRDIPSESTILDRATRAWSDARHDATFRQYSALNAPDLYPQLRLPKPQQRVDEPALWRRIEREYAVEREERAALRNLRLDSPNIGDFISKSPNYNRLKIDEPGAWRLGSRVYEADRAAAAQRLQAPDIGDSISAKIRQKYVIDTRKPLDISKPLPPRVVDRATVTVRRRTEPSLPERISDVPFVGELELLPTVKKPDIKTRWAERERERDSLPSVKTSGGLRLIPRQEQKQVPVIDLTRIEQKSKIVNVQRPQPRVIQTSGAAPRLIAPVIGVPRYASPRQESRQESRQVVPTIFNWKQRVRTVEAIRNAPAGALITIPTVRGAVVQTPTTITAQTPAVAVTTAQTSATARAVTPVLRSAQISTTRHPPRTPPRLQPIRVRPPKLSGGRRGKQSKRGLWTSEKTAWDIATPEIAFFGQKRKKR